MSLSARLVETMKNYEKPVATKVDDLAEGVYMASGDAGDVGGDASETTVSRGCGSKYMNGVFQMPTYNSIEDGYKIGRGCEGCPAWNGNSCRFESAPEEMNWDGDFRPSWEVQGHEPDEKGY